MEVLFARVQCITQPAVTCLSAMRCTFMQCIIAGLHHVERERKRARVSMRRLREQGTDAGEDWKWDRRGLGPHGHRPRSMQNRGA